MNSVCIYFIRHGETIFNALGRVQGWSDTPLTKKGIEQACQLGEKLRSIRFHTVFTSDSIRTQDTANRILSLNHNPVPKVNQLTDLREWFYGSFEGKSDEDLWCSIFQDAGLVFDNEGSNYEQLTSLYSDEEIANMIFSKDPLHLVEPYKNIKARAISALRQIISKTQQFENGNALVISSGSFIPTMLDQLGANRKLSGANFNNCSIVIAKYHNSQIEFIKS